MAVLSPPRCLAVLLALSVLARLISLLAVYPRDPSCVFNPDSTTFLNPARAILSAGTFAPGPQKLDEPEISRTPGYPMFLAPCLAVWDNVALPVALQALVAAATILLTFKLAEKLWGARAACAAATFLALDLASFHVSLMVLSEALFTCLLMLFLWMAARSLAGGQRRLGTMAIVSTLLAAATYVRPIAYYLILPMALGMGLVAGRRGGWRRGLAVGATMLLPFAIAVGAWQARNYAWTGSAAFSRKPDESLYFYRAPGIVALRDGVSFKEAKEAAERALPDMRDWPPRQRYDYYRREGMKVVEAHPWMLVRTQVAGAARMLLVPGESDLLDFFGEAPETSPAGDFVRLPFPAFVQRWAARPGPFLVFAAYALLLAAVYLLSLLGLVDAWGKEPAMREVHVMLWGVALYLIILSAGPESYARFRVCFMPVLCLYAGRGFAWWAGRKQFEKPPSA